jgi:XTP/dITP diphosphohydrolase
MSFSLVIATANAHKTIELRELFPDLSIKTLADFPAIPPVVEDGETFEDNAKKKAEEIAAVLKEPVLADDSGICVDVVGGAPGVRSARYAEGSDLTRYEKLLRALVDVPAGLRAARFVCVMALAVPGLPTVLERGVCEGSIAFQPRGEKGFGYDPVFIVGHGPRTMAELPMSEKNFVSHRGRAAAAMRPHLLRMFQRSNQV